MKRDFASRLLFPLCGMLALTVTSCNKTAKDQPSRHRFIHNNDGSDALLNRWFGGHPAHKADIDRYVDMVAETSKGRTQVTTFMMCSGSDFIYYPSSKYGRYFGDDKNGTMPYADSATKKVWQLGGQSVRNLEAEGTDVIKASLERAKMHGMEAFITYRVNDLHFADSSSGNPATFPDFWIEHPEYWTGRPDRGDPAKLLQVNPHKKSSPGFSSGDDFLLTFSSGSSLSARRDTAHRCFPDGR